MNDLGDCAPTWPNNKECSDGCPWDWIGDEICDEACLTEDCSQDDNDCE